MVLPVARLLANMAKAFTRQRITRSGQSTQTTTSTTYAQVTGWASDTTYPGVVDTNSLKNAGAKTGVTVTASVGWTNSAPANGAASFDLRKNGTSIASWTQSDFSSSGTQTLTATGQTIADGDLITLWIRRQSGSATIGCTAATYIDLNA